VARSRSAELARPSQLLDSWRLAQTEGVGPIAWRRLLARYGSAAAALDALPRLARAGGRSAPPVIPTAAEAEKQLDGLRKFGARLLVLDDPGYPPLLAMLDDAPPVIAVQGDPSLLATRAIAMVGGRNASANGQRMAENLASALARSVAVVSGLARGIDAAAHAGALTTGRTIAVVAGGLDLPYPPENAALQRRIAEAGAVVAEMPLGTTPQARHFPRRNRIIAGLSLGVVVVEAATRSGSLITARIAQDIGREVFAVPGSPTDPRSRGTNDLLRQGAILTETAADVLDNLPEHPMLPSLLDDSVTIRPGLAESRPELVDNSPDLPQARSQVLDLLGPSPTPVDDVVRRCQFSPAAVMVVLLELELAGRLELLPGNRVALLTDEARISE
jgi:DNA processing protein